MPTAQRTCVRCDARGTPGRAATYPRGDGYYCAEGCAALAGYEAAKAADPHPVSGPKAGDPAFNAAAGVTRDRSAKPVNPTAPGTGIMRDTSPKAVAPGTDGAGVDHRAAAPPRPQTGQPASMQPVAAVVDAPDDSDLPVLDADDPRPESSRKGRKKPSRRRKD